MSIKIEIVAESQEELIQKVASLAVSLGFGGWVQEQIEKKKEEYVPGSEEPKQVSA